MAENDYLRLQAVVSFVEGALNVDIALSIPTDKSEDKSVFVSFPSETAKDGWFDDCFEFESFGAAIEFFTNVRLMIDIGRIQQREPYNHEREPYTEDKE